MRRPSPPCWSSRWGSKTPFSSHTRVNPRSTPTCQTRSEARIEAKSRGQRQKSKASRPRHGRRQGDRRQHGLTASMTALRAARPHGVVPPLNARGSEQVRHSSLPRATQPSTAAQRKPAHRSPSQRAHRTHPSVECTSTNIRDTCCAQESAAGATHLAVRTTVGVDVSMEPRQGGWRGAGRVVMRASWRVGHAHPPHASQRQRRGAWADAVHGTRTRTNKGVGTRVCVGEPGSTMFVSLPRLRM